MVSCGNYIFFIEHLHRPSASPSSPLTTLFCNKDSKHALLMCKRCPFTTQKMPFYNPLHNLLHHNKLQRRFLSIIFEITKNRFLILY